MNWLRLYWAQALLGVCALVSGVTFAWPSSGSTALVAERPERYNGPVFADRKGGVLPGFPLRLTAPRATEAPPPATEALPVLVGVANGQAYLRSAATGEVERAARGQTIDGWVLTSIGARSVTLSNGEAERKVIMFTSQPPIISSTAKNAATQSEAIASPPATPES